uniref:Uncharacterized protein n=1 Tax=viral metagenome TaxID=1070528 RepID=A0A6M3M8W2_9ZZZZ
MYRYLILLLFLLYAFSTFALAEESDIQVFDQKHRRQLIIKQKGNQFDIFDKLWRRKGFIRGDNFYDERWNRKSFIMKGGDIEREAR